MKEGSEILRILDKSKIHNSVFDRKFMYLSDIIDPLYKEYAIRLERNGKSLDLDVMRRHHQIENYVRIAKILTLYFEYALKSTEPGEIVISMSAAGRRGPTDLSPVEYNLIIKDTSVLMSVDQREQFAMLGAKVKSKENHGTLLSIPILEPYDRI